MFAIAFFHVGPNVELPTLMVASCKKAMPDMEVFQLTDQFTPQIPNVDVLLRRQFDTSKLMTARLAMYAMLPDDGHEFLFLDTDVIMEKDVRWVFNVSKTFDVACLKRQKIMVQPPGFPEFPELTGTNLAEVMPYNTGVIFSRNQSLWRDAHNWLTLQPERYHRWFGDQTALAYVIDHMKYDFFPLTEELNYTPKSETEDLSRSFITHYKGNRKPWMLNRKLYPGHGSL